MSNAPDAKPEGERRVIASALSESAMTGGKLDFDYNPIAMMPDVKVMKIGG